MSRAGGTHGGMPDRLGRDRNKLWGAGGREMPASRAERRFGQTETRAEIGPEGKPCDFLKDARAQSPVGSLENALIRGGGRGNRGGAGFRGRDRIRSRRDCTAGWLRVLAHSTAQVTGPN